MMATVRICQYKRYDNDDADDCDDDDCDHTICRNCTLVWWLYDFFMSIGANNEQDI